jgi:murein DD-endopeptidase MepM/ murein hydrolase activator NlpD
MHIIITDIKGSGSRALEMSGARLTLLVLLAVLLSSAMALWGYMQVLQLGARYGWNWIHQIAVVSNVVDDVEAKRLMRENLDAMARRLGELQARLIQIDALGERVARLAGVNYAPQDPPGQGGAETPGQALSAAEFSAAVTDLQALSQTRLDSLSVLESQLFELQWQQAQRPTMRPVDTAYGSGFGMRIDPFNGQRAMHQGLDFPAPTGTPIRAAAGGVVVTSERHAGYGLMVEIDHGNDLTTRYAHASKLKVKVGDLVKRGQVIALVGSTGRSTGPHLHFEVWAAGRPRNPVKFLASARSSTAQARAP